jgi:hypothetical protein
MRALLALIAAVPLAAQVVPEIGYRATANLLQLPEHVYLGEAAGVATNSKGNIFVYTRTGGSFASLGTSRTFTHGGARLFEFDPTGKFVREIGEGVYGFLFAQAVRVDARDNIWVVDRGSNMVIEFNPEGRVVMTLSRKPEASGGGGAGRGGQSSGAGIPGDSFNRPTGVAWDAAGNIFVSDGYGNARVAKMDKTGKFVKSWGQKGDAPGQFNVPHSIAVDPQGNVYVADLGNKRIQVFDNDGNYKSAITGIGTPWAICISPGAHPYLFSSNSNDPRGMEGGEIYRLELDGKILGRFGRAGKLEGEFGTVNQIDCRNPNEIYVGELTNWRVQRLQLSPK